MCISAISKKLFGLLAALLCCSTLLADPPAEMVPGPLDGRDGRDLALDQFRPRSTLRVPDTTPQRAKFPVVDVHVHPRIRLHHSPDLLDEFVRVMDAHQIAVCVSLDGGIGEAFREHREYLWTKHRDRFVIFANLDFRGTGLQDDPATWDVNRPDFARRMVEGLREAHKLGASGLKLFKDFGLTVRNADSSLVAIDDPRFDPIWEVCGELKMPVIMHTSDPEPFFQPIDQYNERWEELHRHPEWSFYGPRWPKREDLLAARNRVIARHRATTFIGAHLAESGNDLATLAEWLDTYPNLVVETASRINELGRQPYTTQDFFEKYADRIMFGTDGPRPPARLYPNWRFYETRDEYFPYAENPFPPQGFWNIYGIGLSDEKLKQLYHQNAARIIPGVAERLETWNAKHQ